MNSKERFTTRADDYVRARPTYAAEIIAAILNGFVEPRVADLGAGTGISSTQLANAGALVFAIEPNARMRSEIAPHARIRVLDGSAERTGLPNASINIVTAFQAYHWFDALGVMKEAARIATSRARFAAVWNHRDADDPFGKELELVIDHYDESGGTLDRQRRETAVEGDLRDAGWRDVRTEQETHRKRFDWELLVALLHSASYLPRSGPRHDAMLSDARELFDRSAENGAVHIQYVSKAHLGERYGD